MNSHSKTTNANTNPNTQTDTEWAQRRFHTGNTGAGSRNQNLRHTECWSRKEEESPFESQPEGQDPKDRGSGRNKHREKAKGKK